MLSWLLDGQRFLRSSGLRKSQFLHEDTHLIYPCVDLNWGNNLEEGSNRHLERQLQQAVLPRPWEERYV